LRSIALEQGARAVATGVRTALISDPLWLGAGAIPIDVANARPTLVPKLLHALGDAVRYIESHDAESRAVLARRTGTDAAVAERSALYHWVAYPDAHQLEQIQAAVDLLYQEKMIEAPVTVRALFAGIRPEWCESTALLISKESQLGAASVLDRARSPRPRPAGVAQSCPA